MVATEIAAAFVVIESQLACELPVVKLDGPAQPRKPGDTFKWFVFGEVGEPVIGGLGRSFGPFGL